jgi:hypothetical protein
MGGAMATVYVTASVGDTYRIEGVHLDPDGAYRFAQDYQRDCP